MINIISEPAVATSVYNPNIWIVDSVNRNKDGFRYLAKIYQTDRELIENLTLVKTIRFLPRPDGKGEFDLSFFLQNQTYFKDEERSTIFIKNNGLRFDYRIEFGEEYFDSWRYADTEFLPGAKTKAVGNSAPPFIAGDVVQITPDDPTLFPLFNGVQLVEDVQGNDVYFDIPFSSTPTNGGSLWYADNRKTTVWNGSKTNAKTVYRAKIDFEKWTKNYFKDTYFVDSYGVLKHLPINTVDGFLFKPNQVIYIPVYISPGMLTKVEIEDADGVTSVNVPSAYRNGINNCYFTIANRSKDFTVRLIGSLRPNPLTEKIHYTIDDRCSVNDLFLIYEDKFGALNSWAFSGFSEKRLNVEKSEYNKPLNYTDAGEYENEMNRVGYTILDVSSSTEITLHGYAFPRKQDLLFEDLLKSKVYILHDATNNTFRRCTVVDNSATFFDEKRTGLRRRNITIKFSNE